VIGLPPRARGDSMRPRRLAGASARPLNFTVRRTMHAWARSSLFFAAGFWAAVVLTGAGGIYGFDYYERAWGRGPSLQVYTWIASLGAVVALFPAGFGFRLGGGEELAPGPIVATISGAALVLVLWLISFLLPDRMPHGPIILLADVAAAFCIAYLVSVIRNRLATGPSNNRWRGP
jgi:hypothetical protein